MERTPPFARASELIKLKEVMCVRSDHFDQWRSFAGFFDLEPESSAVSRNWAKRSRRTSTSFTMRKWEEGGEYVK